MNAHDPERLLHAAISRRGFLAGSLAVLGVTLTSHLPGRRVLAQPRFAANPFALGVASGDPVPDGVVLWTRLAPDPLGGSGLPAEAVSVGWEIAQDERMERVVARGTAMAVPELGHSVHVEAGGLEPARVYHYRFRAGDFVSPVGRTRTAPAAGGRVERLRFAFASCSDWQNGYFNGYRHMAAEDLDLVVHLGDYIYEYGPRQGAVRQHNGPEIVSLDDYRRRYALYRTDPFLQAAHAAHPWVVTWDDHELDNNYAGNVPEDAQTPEVLLARRAAAYQAYYENMPLRRTSMPRGPSLALYRRLAWGDLAELSVLDTRQYRSDQPCGDGLKARCAAALDPNATMTGPDQERWLLEGLGRSAARWNVVGQQTMMAQFDFAAGAGQGFNLDQWDGYVAARNRILGYFLNAKPANPVVLTGDIHSSWAHDLKADFDSPTSASVGTEFICTSISADFPTQSIAPVQAALPDNPHTRFFDAASRGYASVELTPERWRTDFRAVSTIIAPESTVSTLASFVVENGRPGAQRA